MKTPTFDLNELKVARVRQGLTQRDMGKVLGISAPSYSKKEAGIIKIGVDEFAKIAEILKIEDISIFFKEGVDKRQQKEGDK